MGCRLAILIVLQASLATVFADVASADNYPISGAWALLDPNEPVVAAESCASYEKTPKNVVGNLIVFTGAQKLEFNGGYLEEETVTNISIRQTKPNEFQVTDRFYDDGEDGGKAGYKKRTYHLALGDGRLSIAVGNYPVSVYVACTKISSNQTTSPTPKGRSSPGSGTSPSVIVESTERHLEAPNATHASNTSGIWPLGPPVEAEDAALLKIIDKLRAVPGKSDLLGFSPGMTYENALNILGPLRDIERKDGRCEVFAFASDVLAEFARRGQRMSCATKDGRLSINFSPNLPIKRIISVVLDFPSGASPSEMVQNVTDRYGGTPQDVSPSINCGATRNNGIGFPMAVYSKANGEYERCLNQNKQTKLHLVHWSLANGLVLKLERQERYYDDTSNFGFTVTLESPDIISADRLASQTNIRSLNSKPELTISKNDLIGIRPGMSYAQVLNVITSHGYYFRPLSQPVAVDVSGQPLPYCDDPDENSDRSGTRLNCIQSKEQTFALEFGFAGALVPPVLSSFQFKFTSGLDEMIAYISDQFGALPTKITNSGGLQVALWSLSPSLALNLRQEDRRSWTLIISDSGIVEENSRAIENAKRARNVRPPF